MSDLQAIKQLIQDGAYDEAYDALREVDDPEADSLRQFILPFIGDDKLDTTEVDAQRQTLIEKWVKQEKQIYFAVAMFFYLASAVVSIINPTVTHRTGLTIEVFFNTTVNLWLVPLGIAFYWLSRQTESITRRIRHLDVTAHIPRSQSILTVAGAIVLAFSSWGSPIILTIAGLVLLYGVMQWRWLNHARDLMLLNRSIRQQEG